VNTVLDHFPVIPERYGHPPDEPENDWHDLCDATKQARVKERIQKCDLTEIQYALGDFLNTREFDQFLAVVRSEIIARDDAELGKLVRERIEYYTLCELEDGR
jgi:hypothetical protein